MNLFDLRFNLVFQAWPLAAFAASSVGGCAPQEHPGNEPTFAVYAQHAAWLRPNFDLVTSQPESSIPVCVSWLGFEDAHNLKLQIDGPRSPLVQFPFEKRSAMVESWVRQALGAWFEHRGFPNLQEGESRPSRRAAFVHMQNQVCPGSFWRQSNAGEPAPGLKVVVFADAKSQQEMSCDPSFAGSARLRVFDCPARLANLSSQGDFPSATLSLSPLASGRPRPLERFPVTVLHEFGHIFGLFDQYQRSDVSFLAKYAPPPSVMAYTSETLTADDLAGIGAAFSFAQSGVARCGTEALREGIPLGFNHGVLFCKLIKSGFSPRRESHE